MANPLPNENEILRKIQDQKMSLPPEIWDVIYSRLGDQITSIELLVSRYADSNWSMPKEDLKKIIERIEFIGKLIHKLCDADKIEEGDELFPLKDKIKTIPTEIKELMAHHIPNDCHSIIFIAGDALDDGYLKNEYEPRILARTASMMEFLEKLRKVTFKANKS